MSEELEQTEEVEEAPDTQVEAPDTESEEAVEEPAVEEPATEIVEEDPPHELSRPPVIDLKAMLQPIPGENPAGEYMRYSGVYDEIGEARREDDILGQEDIQSQLKVADFRRVIELAVPVIEKESKDLQISAWLAEALVKEHGFEGLRDSLKLMSGLQEKFWETLYPEIDEGDMEGRANAIAWFENEAAFEIQKAQITDGEGYSFLDYQDSKKYDFPDNIETLDYEVQDKFKALEAEARKLNKVTADKWKQAIASSRRAFYEELNVVIEECKEGVKALNLTIEEKFDRNQAPGLSNLQKSLENINSRVNKLLIQKREEEPDEVEEEYSEEEETQDGTSSGGKGSVSSTRGTVENRKEALRQLEKLAEFFRKTEPHSPVSYLVTRAVKWGNMPLESWLKDVIKDETILFQLRQTLGFNTTTDSPEEAESTGEGV
jgi:type VI secretion system protein ImpA